MSNNPSETREHQADSAEPVDAATKDKDTVTKDVGNSDSAPPSNDGAPNLQSPDGEVRPESAIEISSPTPEAAEAAAPPSNDESEAAAPEDRSTFRYGKIQIGAKRGESAERPKSKPQPIHLAKSDSDAVAEAMGDGVSTAGLVPTGDPVPKPSRRDEMTPDLEKEMDAALGSVSIDELMSGDDIDSAGEELEAGSRHLAKVIRVEQEHVFVTIGGRNEGAIPLLQFKEPPEDGSEVEVVVKQLNSDEGLYDFALPGASIEVGDWSDLSEGAVVEARITGSNTGGLECKLNQIRGFIPSSQIATFRVEDFADYIDAKLLCVVTEVNPKRRNLVLSHRAYLEREREASRKELLENLEVGQTHDGIVRKLQDFGAFVDIGGIDGLVHVSQLSWDRVKHPSEVVSVGEKIKVRIEKINKDTGKIGLSYRDLKDHPWTDIESRFSTGTVVNGSISKVATFGAFVKLAPGVEGLVHISELAHQRVPNVASIVSEGQEVSVKILSVDPEAQRIALSIKETTAAPKHEESSGGKDSDDGPREIPVKKNTEHLKGGIGRASGGEQFGLKW